MDFWVRGSLLFQKSDLLSVLLFLRVLQRS